MPGNWHPERELIGVLGTASCRPDADTWVTCNFPSGVAPANGPLMDRRLSVLWEAASAASTPTVQRRRVLELLPPGG